MPVDPRRSDPVFARYSRDPLGPRRFPVRTGTVPQIPLAPAAGVGVRGPGEDPAFLAFLRAQGFEEADARAELARRIGALRRRTAFELSDFPEQEQRQQEGIEGDFLNRGVFRSGARLLAQQRLAEDFARRKYQLQQGAADEEAGLQAQLARDVAAGRRRQAEEELGARGRLEEEAGRARAALIRRPVAY